MNCDDVFKLLHSFVSGNNCSNNILWTQANSSNSEPEIHLTVSCKHLLSQSSLLCQPQQLCSHAGSRHYAIFLLHVFVMQIRKYTNSLQNFKNIFTFFPCKAFLFIKCREILHTAKIKCAQNCPLAANFVCLFQYQWFVCVLLCIQEVSGSTLRMSDWQFSCF